ncbi:MAG: hypothetical protein Q8Q40_11755 [Methylococcaceae bacterium]|nr:hypothetical protein [Methylococcaceae bacterium]MDP3904635.1 hypothetical protein [Methylococcaceae bacterium]
MAAENRKTQSKFEHVECGYAENADLNPAINILRAGHARLACQVNGAEMPSATAIQLIPGCKLEESPSFRVARMSNVVMGLHLTPISIK